MRLNDQGTENSRGVGMHDFGQQPTRVGVIGVGHFGAMHARTLAGLDEAQLVAIVDSDPRAIASLQKDLPDVPAWSSVELAIERANAQAWVIATRTESHVPLAAMVLTHGSAALVEKPLAADLATARQLERLVRSDSSNLMLGHIVLFAREYRRLLTEVQRRGPIRFFNAVRHRPAALAKKFPEENPLRFTMVHDLYMAFALMNGVDPEHMSARMRPRGDGSGGFDVACADLRWPGGAWGSLTASFLTPPGMPEDGFDRFEVFGADWAARVDLNPQPLQVFSDRAQWPLGLEIDDDPAAPSGWLAEELRQFCRVVACKAAVPLGCRYQDALQLQRWMECLEGSARAVTADSPAQKDDHV